MNILCNEGDFVGKFVNEGDIAMREIGPKWGSLPPNGGTLATMLNLIMHEVVQMFN